MFDVCKSLTELKPNKMTNIKGSGFAMIMMVITMLFGALGATVDIVHDVAIVMRDANARKSPFTSNDGRGSLMSVTAIDMSAPAKRSPVHGRIVYSCVSLIALCCVAGMFSKDPSRDR